MSGRTATELLNTSAGLDGRLLTADDQPVIASRELMDAFGQRSGRYEVWLRNDNSDGTASATDTNEVVTLVSLGVGMGALAPNFNAENPLQVGLSLGGFGYMAAALAYVAAVMMLMARPIVQYMFWRVFGVETEFVVAAVPVLFAVVLSLALIVLPLLIAEKRLAALSESR